MGIEFDPISKHIKITSPTTTLTALEIYSLAMDWCDEQLTMGYTVPMRAVGKFDMPGGVYSDSIFMLQNGWKIKFWSGTYQAIITGTLLPEPGQPRTVPPDTGNVEVTFTVSSQATVIPDPSEWTQTEKNGVISGVDEVKNKLPADPASNLSIQTVGESLQRHDSEIKGEPLQDHAWDVHDASLLAIKETLEEVKLKEAPTRPKSIAQHLERS